MPAERFYYNLPFKEKETITLKDQEFHHLVHVMRATQGDVIELIDGKGALAKGHVMDIQKRQAFLHIDEVTFFSLPRPKIVLAQAIPRMPRLDFILEKGTELGMTDLWLFPGQRSE